MISKSAKLSPSSERSRLGLFFLALTAWACAPIWAVDYFVPQDGAAHAYSASLMLELLQGNAAVAQHFAWNAWTVPNSSGHWILALLLGVASPFAATKVLATLTYAGVVAAVGFLRFTTVGRDGLLTSLLLGAALGFNWLWLCGLYNFLIGVIGLAVTLGLFFRWRERWSPSRVAGLALLLVLVYFSHLVAFGVLAASLVLLAASGPASQRRASCTGVCLSLLPALLLALLHGSVSAGESYFPIWRRLTDSGSMASWIFQIRTADPFVLISRRAFPFTRVTSSALVIFTPLLWLLAAVGGLTWATLWSRVKEPQPGTPAPSPALAAIGIACALTAMVGPDDFGTSHGTLLRERLFLLAMLFFVPLFRSAGGGGLRRTRLAQVCLAAVILFQTAALWEYARSSSDDAREFLALGDALEDRESLASVIVLDEGKRFHSNPTAQMSNFFGIGRRTVVWDNYEIGYGLFPLVARSAAEARFILEFTSLNVFDVADPASAKSSRLAQLDRCLAANREKIGTLLLWSRDPQVEAVLGKWFESEPFFEHGRGRLYRRRADPAAPFSRGPVP